MKRRVSIYQVFPRVYSKNGKLNDVTNDIKRIADMGFDYLYLLPVHPIGKVGRKGDLGSPYAIADYMEINEEIGTLEDFKNLLHVAHENGLKVIMDIVINHTANDTKWIDQHPEYYYQENGKPFRKFADWSDVSDLNYDNPDLRKEIIKMLEYWAKLGVDGYRCDVASGVPADFWHEADIAVKAINPDFYWLAESTHLNFISGNRRNGHKAASDGELAQVFDTLYPYSFDREFKDALSGKNLNVYATMLNYTYTELSTHVNELMYLENHDQPRIAEILKDNRQRMSNWLAFSFIYDGVAFVYAGQEAYNHIQPTLFDKVEVDWSKLDHEYEKEIKHLNTLRKEILDGVLDCEVKGDNALKVSLYHKEYLNYGVFDVNDVKGDIEVEIEDGVYTNILDGNTFKVSDGKISSNLCPVLVKVPR